MRRLYPVVIFVLLSFSALSQASFPLKGKIVNASGEGIQKASIVLLNTGLGSITDPQGNFELPLLSAGKYQLLVTAMGYASVLKEADLGQDFQPMLVTMAASYTRLDEVIVSAEKAEERLQCLPSTVSSVSSRQVSELRLWNISGITGVVPNLYSANSGDNRNVTSIRPRPSVPARPPRPPACRVRARRRCRRCPRRTRR